MNKFKKVSDNSLRELLCLMGEVRNKIEEYAHVAEYIPKPVSNVLEKYWEELNLEQDKREYSE